MTAYRYDGSFAGFLTCVWDALEHNIEPTAFLLTEDGATLWEERELPVDEEKARRLYAALARRVSGRFRHFIAWGFLTCLPQRELALFTLIRRGMREGRRAAWDLSDPVMARVMLAYQKLATEQDHLKGFVRFSDLDGMLVGEIEPKNRVLPFWLPTLPPGFPGKSWPSMTGRTGRSFSPTGADGGSFRRRTFRWGRPVGSSGSTGSCGGGIFSISPLKGGSIPSASPPICPSGIDM